MKETKLKKPPVGLKPRNIHDTARINEILSAMRRYTEAGKRFPDEWIKEIGDLNKTFAK